MKFLIAFALFAVVSALPAGHGFGHREHEDHQIDGPSSHQNKHQQINLIKIVYRQLIERLNNPPEDDKEEEERAINDIVDTINIIGKIIHDKSNDCDDNNDYNRSPILQHPDDDVPNSPPRPVNEVPPNVQDEYVKLPSTYGSKEEVISVVDKLPAGDENKSSDLSLVDNVEDDESEHDVSSFVNQKDDEESHIMVYNSNVANEIPALKNVYLKKYTYNKKK